jgi:signal transduction histidine kinase
VADEKDITLTTDIPHTLLVQVDAGRMRQALANLLDNAVKYTPQGGCVTVQATAWPNNDAYTACLTVRDTGIGIPAHEQPRIWDRLYRGDQSRTERGLGLGLSLVQAIVQAHEGRVEVESATNEGTAIHIWLP